jgi:hypothetical protein
VAGVTRPRGDVAATDRLLPLAAGSTDRVGRPLTAWLLWHGCVGSG